MLNGRNLAEISILYTLALGLGLFALLFAVAATTTINAPIAPFLALVIFTAWSIALIYFTIRLIKSAAVQNAKVTLAPIHLLQFVLLAFTIPHFIFSRQEDSNTLQAILLTWEVFAVIFTCSFLFLASFARKKIAARTWIYSLASIFFVFGTVYARIQKS